MSRFEDWILETSRRSGTHIDKSTNGTYLDNRVAAKYSAWKASKTLPTSKQVLDTYHNNLVRLRSYYQCRYLYVSDGCC